MLDYPNKLDIIFDKLNKQNAKPIIVGGFVRDCLLGIESKDIDIEVYNIPSYEKLENLLKEFGTINSVGKSFGVCKLDFADMQLDFSLPRKDSKISKGHNGFEAKINPHLDFKTATSRRDFTINAIGYDPIEKKILDPFSGQKDLKEKRLKVVDPKKFIQDPLRILRGMQFCARFELTPDKNLLDLSKKMIGDGLLEELSKDRIYTEFEKLFLKGKKISAGLEFLKITNGIEYFSELKMKRDQWKTTTNFLDRFANKKTGKDRTDILFAFAMLCYELEDDKTKNFLDKVTNKKDLSRKVLQIKNITKYIQKRAKTPSYKEIISADIDEIRCFLDFLDIKTDLQILKPILTPKDLIRCNINPSKEFSAILDKAYQTQMEKKFTTHTQAVKWLCELLPPQ